MLSETEKKLQVLSKKTSISKDKEKIPQTTADIQQDFLSDSKSICELFTINMSSKWKSDCKELQNLLCLKIFLEPLRCSKSSKKMLEQTLINSCPEKTTDKSVSFASSKMVNLYLKNDTYVILSFPIGCIDCLTFYNIVRCGFKAKGKISLSEGLLTITRSSEIHKYPESVHFVIKHLHEIFSSIERINGYVKSGSKIRSIYIKIESFIACYRKLIPTEQYDAIKEEIENLCFMDKNFTSFDSIDRMINGTETNDQRYIIDTLKNNQERYDQQGELYHFQDNALYRAYQQMLDNLPSPHMPHSTPHYTNRLIEFGKDVMDICVMTSLLFQSTTLSIQTTLEPSIILTDSTTAEVMCTSTLSSSRYI